MSKRGKCQRLWSNEACVNKNVYSFKETVPIAVGHNHTSKIIKEGRLVCLKPWPGSIQYFGNNQTFWLYLNAFLAHAFLLSISGFAILILLKYTPYSIISIIFSTFLFCSFRLLATWCTWPCSLTSRSWWSCLPASTFWLRKRSQPTLCARWWRTAVASLAC